MFLNNKILFVTLKKVYFTLFTWLSEMCTFLPVHHDWSDAGRVSEHRLGSRASQVQHVIKTQLMAKTWNHPDLPDPYSSQTRLTGGAAIYLPSAVRILLHPLSLSLSRRCILISHLSTTPVSSAAVLSAKGHSGPPSRAHTFSREINGWSLQSLPPFFLRNLPPLTWRMPSKR